FKKFMDMLEKIQVQIPLCEALEHMMVYAKFMKEFLLGKRKLENDKNVAWPKSAVLSFNKSFHPNSLIHTDLKITKHHYSSKKHYRKKAQPYHEKSGKKRGLEIT
ncbi:hypothetical protein KIW84_025226, partial [Lathyrus oleraceus]